MGRRGKPRAIGRKGAQRRVRPLHQVRRSPIVKSVHWHNVLYVAMGECDRKSLIKLNLLDSSSVEVIELYLLR